jgi:hypothetical protein
VKICKPEKMVNSGDPPTADEPRKQFPIFRRRELEGPVVQASSGWRSRPKFGHGECNDDEEAATCEPLKYECRLVRFAQAMNNSGIHTPHIIAAGPPYGIEKSNTALEETS